MARRFELVEHDPQCIRRANLCFGHIARPSVDPLALRKRRLTLEPQKVDPLEAGGRIHNPKNVANKGRQHLASQSAHETSPVLRAIRTVVAAAAAAAAAAA
jgi:protein-tyrosine phosphatase